MKLIEQSVFLYKASHLCGKTGHIQCGANRRNKVRDMRKDFIMTRAEAKNFLIKLGVAEPTDEQITNYLDSVDAETKKEKDKAERLKDKAAKADELQKELDGIKKEGLSDLEKAQSDNAELQNQIAELRASNFKSEAKAILGKAGLEDADIEALLPGMVAGLDKIEDVQTRTKAYVDTLNKVRENAVKQKEKEELDDTGTPGGKGGNGEEENKTEAAKYAESLIKSNGTESKNSDSIIGNYK